MHEVIDKIIFIFTSFFKNDIDCYLETPSLRQVILRPYFAVLDALNIRSEPKSYTLHTFDVFDTCVTRLVGKPEDVHLLVGRLAFAEHLITINPTSYAHARTRAELRACSRVSQEEVTLDDIFEVLSEEMLLPDDIVSQLTALEISLQFQMVYPVPSALKMIQSLRASNCCIGFLSDTYFPSWVVSQILSNLGISEAGDIVLVSSTASEMKANGKMYLKASRLVGCEVTEISHLGDHSFADCVVPRRLGAHSSLVNWCKLNVYEKILEAYYGQTGGLASIMAGTSRAARIHYDSGDAIATVAAGVASPILMSYVLWLLRKSRAKGLQRLYFISRDGEILFDIAKNLVRRLGWSLDLRYFYGGRQAFHLAACAIRTQLDFGLWHDADQCSLETLLRRVDLNVNDLGQLVKRYSLEKLRPYTPLGRKAELFRSLTQDKQFINLVRNRAVLAFEKLFSYAKQEGLFDGCEYGLVDLGWTGRALNSLMYVLKSANNALSDSFPHIFYFGYFREWAESATDLADVHRSAWLFESLAEIGGCASIYPMEVFCSGTHGPVRGYRKDDRGHLGPDLELPNSIASRWDSFHRMRECIQNFVNVFPLEAGFIDLHADMRDPAHKLLQQFWLHPTREERKAWGSFPYEYDQLGDVQTLLSRPYGLRDLWGLAHPGKISDPQRLWHTADLAQTPLPLWLGAYGAQLIGGRNVRHIV